MEKVRAKFTCDSVTDYGGSKSARLRAVSGKEGENADFTKFTPNGGVEITIAKNAPAEVFFVPGQNYYVDFIKSE